MTEQHDPSNIHGSAIVLGHQGVLVIGPSGSGKTTLCQRLIDQWKSSGQFAAWVGDDQIVCEVLRAKHMANAAPEIAGLAERYFSGIHQVDHQKSAVLDLEVCLVPLSQLERLPEVKTSKRYEALASMNVPEQNANLAMELIIQRLKSI